MDLLTEIREAEAAVALFLNNQFLAAERRMAAHADQSIYHALGHGTILFIKAMMSCEKNDMDKAMEALVAGCALVEQFRAKYSLAEAFFHRLLPKSHCRRHFTDVQIHAELCYAELLVLRNLLTFFCDESLAGLIRGAFRVRACYHSFKECHHRLLHSPAHVGSDPLLRRQFEAGVRAGVGIFNLMLSTLPAKLVVLLELVGFSGDRDFGMAELLTSASMSDTLRAPLSAMVLLSYHLVLSHLIDSRIPDLAFCAQLLKPLAQRFPNVSLVSLILSCSNFSLLWGAVVLFLRARFHLISGELDQAIQLYHSSMRSQKIYKQFHHICHWELIFAHILVLRWNRAAWHAKKLLEESRWSKCVYTYLLAILIGADRTAQRRKEAVIRLLGKVPEHRWRIAGKSIPVEKFCERRARKCLQDMDDAELFLAQFEFLYFWNGFAVLEKSPNLVRPILDHADREWERWREGKGAEEREEGRMMVEFVRGMCRKALGEHAKAEQCFKTIIDNEPWLVSNGSLNYHLLPNSYFELALMKLGIESENSNGSEAEALLTRTLCYKGYAMETRLHFRIHNILEELKRNRGRRRQKG